MWNSTEELKMWGKKDHYHKNPFVFRVVSLIFGAECVQILKISPNSLLKRTPRAGISSNFRFSVVTVRISYSISQVSRTRAGPGGMVQSLISLAPKICLRGPFHGLWGPLGAAGPGPLGSGGHASTLWVLQADADNEEGDQDTTSSEWAQVA
jgi:hypothetical protein